MTDKPTPLQGLAAYLRAEADSVIDDNSETLRIWATEVEAASQLATPASPVHGHALKISREELAEFYVWKSGKREHANDCATSNAPALMPGPCDCDFVSQSPVQGEPVAYRSLQPSGSYTYCNTPQFFDNAEPVYTHPTQAVAVTDAEFLASAEKCGAKITGKPDGSEPITVVFSIAAWQAFAASKASQAVEPSITLDFKQATELLAMFGGEPSEITLQAGDGHSGKGIYAYYSDYPEEGAEYLGVSDDDATPTQQASQTVEPEQPASVKRTCYYESALGGTCKKCGQVHGTLTQITPAPPVSTAPDVPDIKLNFREIADCVISDLDGRKGVLCLDVDADIEEEIRQEAADTIEKMVCLSQPAAVGAVEQALEQAETALINFCSHQSASTSPNIHEYGQARRALGLVRAALASKEALK